MILRNYHNMLAYNMMTTAPVVATTAGEHGTVSSPNVSLKGAISTLLTNYGGAGVVLGDGDTPVSSNDYRLAGNLITGFVYSQTSEAGRTGQKVWAKGKYTITNNNASHITIREIGMLQAYASSSYCMIDRQLLDSPITIEAGGVGQLEYSIEYEVPAEAMGIDLDQEGIYGVSWDYSGSGSEMTRLGSAAGFAAPVPATDLTSGGSSPFDSIYPWSGMKRFNIVDGVIGASESEDGFDPAAETVVFIPGFYYRVQKDPYKTTHQWAISAEPREGFTRHPGSGVYVGRYHTITEGGVYCSKAGVKPTVNISRATARTKSQAKGAGWRLLDYAAWSAIQMLYLIEFADWDSQAVLGTGQDSGALKAAGGTDGAVYHTVVRSKLSNQYRWLEDLWSNCYDWVDGFATNGGRAYLGDPADPDGYSDTYSDMTFAAAMPSSNYICRYAAVTGMEWAFIPSVSTKNELYVHDYVYTAASGTTAAYVGGSYSADPSRGLFFLDAYFAASYSYGNLGSRLLYNP